MTLLLARLLDQTVQVDLCRLLRQVNASQPAVVENVFQRRPVRGAHGQTPPDEMLALWGEKPETAGQLEKVLVHIVPLSAEPRPCWVCSELHPNLPSDYLFRRKEDGRTRATSSS